MDHAGKVSLLTAGRDLARSTGIEIGPRDAPLIRRDMGHVLYADYADTETVRTNYHEFGNDPSHVVEVDIVTGGGKLSAVVDSPVDYIVASHVAEHVPDLLGWLEDLQTCLLPGGTLGLAIPDRRFTFDRFRRESLIAEAVEAYLLRLQRPSIRQIFDSAWMSVDLPVDRAWRNDIPETASEEHRAARLKPALSLVRRVHEAGTYNDAHCWVFTPSSFLDLVDHAARMDLFPYTLRNFHPTELNGYEFYAVMEKAEGEDPAPSIARARAHLATWDAEDVFAEAHQGRDVRASREALKTMQDSTIWRATAPMRKLLDLLRAK